MSEATTAGTNNAANTNNDGRDDFDFFLGAWDGYQRKLKQRLKGCDEWDEFHSVSVARKILGGLGHMDEVRLETPAGPVLGLTLRLFDPQTRQWSIYWTTDKHSVLDEPMIGRFEHGRGLFYDREVFDGQVIISRFIWTSSGADSCRWEQAFSPDGGNTWETNWTMDLTRRTEAGVG